MPERNTRLTFIVEVDELGDQEIRHLRRRIDQALRGTLPLRNVVVRRPTRAWMDDYWTRRWDEGRRC